MIISASRRTDIPALYADWFMRRIEEGSVLVVHPRNPYRFSQVSLHPEVVDGMVFWTKNPLPLMKHLDKLTDYPYYFQFTLNPYCQDVEGSLLPLNQRIDIFRRLADQIGAKKVIWRYDPIFISPSYPLNFHLEQFTQLANKLKGYTEKCIFSFYDHYRHLNKRITPLRLKPLTEHEQYLLAAEFSSIARQNKMILQTCSESIDLRELGITPAACIDGPLFERIAGFPLKMKKDKNQRAQCGCMQSIDIGAYNTCVHNCLYCYAVTNQTLAQQQYYCLRQNKDQKSLIIMPENVTISERKVKSVRI